MLLLLEILGRLSKRDGKAHYYAKYEDSFYNLRFIKQIHLGELSYKLIRNS